MLLEKYKTLSLLESLEHRWLMAFDPTGREQENLEYLNRMRMNPAAEYDLLVNSTDPDVVSALAFFNVDKAALKTAWNSLTPTSPLAWNSKLETAAQGHNLAMLAADSQTHQAPGEADLGTRANNVGYTVWSNLAENVFAYSRSSFYAHAGFAIDWGTGAGGLQDPAGHRINMMASNEREIGIAFLDATAGKTVGPTLVTQDFGNRFSFGNPWLLGTVWKDTNGSGWYNAGEGYGSVSIKIQGTGGTFTTTSLTAGSYQMQVPAGTYTITASGGSLSAPVVISNVVVGSVNIKKDFKISTSSNTAVINGTAFNDANQSQVKDTGEAALSGWTMYIDTNNNGVLDSGEKSTTTSSTGTYSFTGLAAGTYQVRIVTKSGYSRTTPTAGYVNVTVASGATGAATAFGEYLLPVSNTVTGKVYNDINSSGTLNTGEVGLSGWTVYVDANKNGVFDTGEKSTTTTSTGTYLLSGLAGGTYNIRTVLKTGYHQVAPSVGYQSITVTSGQNLTAKDFAETNFGKITGVVFNDTNANGVKDTTETFANGKTVYIDANSNGILDSTETKTTTSSAGVYTFLLAAGTYRVREVLAASTRLSTPSGGYYSLTISKGDIFTAKNFGVTAMARFSGKLFNDANNNKLKDTAEVYLASWRVYVDANNNGKFDTGETSVLTDSTGSWAFNLGAGTYHIRVVLQSTYAFTTPTTGLITATLIAGQNKTGGLFGVKKI